MSCSPILERRLLADRMTAVGYADHPAAARTPALFGRVMALVALTVGFATLGVWVARDWGGAGWFIAWLLSLGCLIGLNVANARGNTGLALGLLLAFGLLIGAQRRDDRQLLRRDRSRWRSARRSGRRRCSSAALGSGGYAVRRDLSFLYRLLFWLLLALLVAGIVLIFVRIPAAYTIWSMRRPGRSSASTRSWTSTGCGGPAPRRRYRSRPGSSSTC